MSLPPDYQRLVQARIARAQKRYPYLSRLRERREEGVVRIRFVIANDGTLAAAGVVESSGYPLLDRAALEIINSAAPFPPPPPGLDQSGVEITVPIKFELRPP